MMRLIYHKFWITVFKLKEVISINKPHPNPFFRSEGERGEGGVYDIDNRDKQLQIEKVLRFFWNEEFSSLFSDKKSLFSNSVGINILMSSISKLDKVLIVFKANKKNLNKKSYKHHIILSENGIIVSVVVPHPSLLPPQRVGCVTTPRPHLMKHKISQNTATVFKKIGTELHRNLLNNEWLKYNNVKDGNYNLELDNIMYEFDNGLSEGEFNTKLSELLGIISNDDYFKLGSDLSEIISENNNLFKFMNIANDDNTIQRVIVAGKET